MADAKPAPWERRYRCYQLALEVVPAFPYGIEHDDGSALLHWWNALAKVANAFHWRIFGGPLPPVDAAGQPQAAEAEDTHVHQG